MSGLGTAKAWADAGSCGAAVGSSSFSALGERESTAGDGNSGGSSSSLYSSTEPAGGDQVSAAGSKIHYPEFEQKKVNLVYMQEEVCKRYKQCHQQMQIVVSSFECVPGLSSTTPYTSSALKTVSKHFRHLKNIISSQLLTISRLLGEEFKSSPCSSPGKTITAPRLGFAQQHQPVWRTQRGLPERALVILRAWLFDHFLHPYPTDTDKHMLATQTGLSRNQVSNWFINSQVRLWKPMVEEIHMLETKGLGGMDCASASAHGSNSKPTTANEGQPSNHQALIDVHSNPLDRTLAEMSREKGNLNLEVWSSEKRSRQLECDNIDTSLMSYGACPAGTDIGGFGAVSLTLGLRHEAAHQQQQHMRQFNSTMLHEFAG